MNFHKIPFKSDLSYSVQNEDYKTELAILDRINRDGLRILLVASSGENALSLLTRNTVAHLHAIDLNTAQIRLCELRWAAAEHLTQDEQLRLLNARATGASSENAIDRRTLYDRLRPHLSAESCLFWDERAGSDLTFGIQHVGRNDVAMRDIRNDLQEAGFAPLVTPLKDEELPDWKKVYENRMTPDYIQELFGLPSRGLSERISQIAGYLGECHFHALRQPLAERNPFVTTVFKGTYAEADAGEDGLPLYLQEAGQAALHRLGISRRLHLHTGNILQWMSSIVAEGDGFDLISISNIADWMSDSEFASVVDSVKSCLNPGGALLARTATPSRMIETVMTHHLSVDVEYNAELQRVERGPWFRIISAGFKD